jgi:hypothetical protein
MPHSIFFIKDGHAIHGSYEVKNLGRPVSHGCVRIAPKNAATLYALVAENGLQNTRVVVTGDTPGGEYNDAEDEETSPPDEYKAARGQTNPRGVRRASGVPYYNGSQGYYVNNGSQGYYGNNRSQGYYGNNGSQGYYGNNGSQGSNGSPWPWFFPH